MAEVVPEVEVVAFFLNVKHKSIIMFSNCSKDGNEKKTTSNNGPEKKTKEKKY